MSRLYGPNHRALQDRFDQRRLADNVEKRVLVTEITAGAQGVHREPRHVLARDHRSRGPADGVLQRRRAGFCARARRHDAGVPLLRRQRHVLFDGQSCRQRQGRPVVSQFRTAASHPRAGYRKRRRQRSAAGRLCRSAAGRACRGDRRSSATVRATSTATARSPNPNTCRIRVRMRRWRRGNASTTCKPRCRNATRTRVAREGGLITRAEYEKYLAHVTDSDKG